MVDNTYCETHISENLWQRLSATTDDSETVGELVIELLEELLGADKTSLDRKGIVAAASRLLEIEDRLWSLIADEEKHPIGLINLNECAVIYASGFCVEVTELYVQPKYRAHAMGAKLLEAALEVGTTRGWTRLEFGAPLLLDWRQSVDFYHRHGFVGPLLKRLP